MEAEHRLAGEDARLHRRPGAEGHLDAAHSSCCHTVGERPKVAENRHDEIERLAAQARAAALATRSGLPAGGPSLQAEAEALTAPASEELPPCV